MTRWYTVRKSFAYLACVTTVLGCHDLSGTQPLPAGTVNPNSVYNAAGGVGMAVTAQALFQKAFGEYIPVSGLLTDELQSIQGSNALTPTGNTLVDARLLDQATNWSGTAPATDSVYVQLQQVRGMAGQAIGALRTYAPDSLLSVRAEMYAFTGYAEVMLADLFCSGIPLSTLDFQGDYTYKPGSTTQQVYQHAIAMFDTAMTLAGDSLRFKYLAEVGKGRAELALGNYADAGTAVTDVPTNFQFIDSLANCGGTNSNYTYVQQVQACPIASNTVIGNITFSLVGAGTIIDREGGIGLPYISSGDPRTAVTQLTSNAPFGFYLITPKKYPVTGLSGLVVASGTEAQLITAEAELNAGNATGAFAILNALRTGNSLTAGKLPTLTDPMTFGAEVDTLFMERAAWLFVDGHRQGDLRRLADQYENTQHVSIMMNGYPAGAYPSSYSISLYGTNIDTSIPKSELINPLFTGCLSRDLSSN